MKISMNKRKIGYTYGSVSGLYPFRGEKSIAFESPLERDFLIMMEFNDAVVDVIGQPMTFEYEHKNGKIVPYTPDFLVYFKSKGNGYIPNVSPKPLLVEVKPRDKLQKYFSDYRHRFQIAMSYAMSNDMVFKIYDDKRIRGTYLENIMFLRRYRKYAYPDVEEDRILSHLATVGHTRVDHLLAFLYVTDSERGLGLGQLWQLVANKKVECDLMRPLGLGITIWLSEKNTKSREFWS